MKSNSLILCIVAIFAFGCSGQIATPDESNQESVSSLNTDKYKLPSGREIKITAINQTTFGNGETGLILHYQTNIPIENLVELTKEVEEIWTIFKVDVEKANTTSGIIRATYITDEGVFVKNGKGYGFVYRKDDKGIWYMDNSKKP